MLPERLDVDLHARAARFGTQPHALEAATDAVIPSGHLTGMRLQELRHLDAAEWVEWAVSQPGGYWPAGFADALETFAAEHYPTALDRRRAA